MILDDHLNKRNRIHCLYMEGLGQLGLQDWQKATVCFEQVLALDASHLGATIHTQLADNRFFLSASEEPAGIALSCSLSELTGRTGFEKSGLQKRDSFS